MKIKAFIAAIIIDLCACSPWLQAEMIFIQGGSFLMGSGNAGSQPIHKVNVDSYYMSKYELTAMEWREYVESTNIYFSWKSDNFLDLMDRKYRRKVPDALGIYNISWYDAILYCNWRSRKEGLRPAYACNEGIILKALSPSGRTNYICVTWDRGANGYRLPTEAEWEYAASFGSALVDSTGQAISKYAVIIDHSAVTGISEVGHRLPNPLGVYDMFGNVSEWCWDFYDARYYEKSSTINPLGPSSGIDVHTGEETNALHVVRGGSAFSASLSFADIYNRTGCDAYTRGFIGFRLVRSGQDGK